MKAITAGNTMQDTRDRWSAIIRDHLSEAVGGIIKAGQALIDANAELMKLGFRPNDWKEFLSDCGLSVSTASKLMSIAGNPVLADVSVWKQLPPSWTTIYQLSQIPDDRLRHAVESDEIRADMTGQDALILMRITGRKRGKTERPHSTVKGNVTSIRPSALEHDDDDDYSSVYPFNELIEESVRDMSPEELADLIKRTHGQDDLQTLAALLTEALVNVAA